MATKTAAPSRPALGSTVKVELEISLGKTDVPIGKLTYVKSGARQFTQFAYGDAWLADAKFFDVSLDLERTNGHQIRKPPTPNDSVFFFALADTEPDSWGRRVIARAHAKARKTNPALGPLTELDYLCAVDDFSRIGALRVKGEGGDYLRCTEKGERTTPPMVELEHVMAASRALESNKETEADLKYLLGKGTSLGGMRPKCTVLEEDGTLALGKFPSVQDERSVTRGEVLALRLAKLAGINVAEARVHMVAGAAVAIIRRFDRTADGSRIPYISGASLLQSARAAEHAYTEVVEEMRKHCLNFADDARQLWRRLVFSHLITNVDDHLQNIGFLYVGSGMWELSPAFDINPFPDKTRESKTWLSEDTGAITSIEQLMSQASRFELKPLEAKAVLAEVVAAVLQWRSVAQSAEVGLTVAELSQFEDAFEHSDLADAKAATI